jgi:hypothetical protein
MRSLALCLAIVAATAAQAAEFELSDFPQDHDTALLVDLSDEAAIVAALFARHPPEAHLRFVRLGLQIRDVQPNPNHFVLYRPQGSSGIIAYARQPGQTADSGSRGSWSTRVGPR